MLRESLRLSYHERFTAFAASVLGFHALPRRFLLCSDFRLSFFSA